MLSTKNTIRNIYLYLFSLVGLGMFIFGASMAVNVALKMYVFKRAEIQNYLRPTSLERVSKDVSVAKVFDEEGNRIGLSEKELSIVRDWLKDYEEWNEMEVKRDRVAEARERNLSNAFSYMIVGFPIFLFHWLIIIRDVRRNREY